VALKFAVAELTGRNSEIQIYRHLASQSGTHPGSERVIALLDHFRVQGANGEHDVLVLQVVGPHLEAMFHEDPTVIQQSIKSLTHQVALGTSFLHHCGVVHAGQLILFSNELQELTCMTQICINVTSRSRYLILTESPRRTR
jgi:serine/threonine-protein kinase SRPK3